MSLCELKECGAALEAVLQAHAVEEDQLLFGALSGLPDSVRAALDALYAEHQEMRRLLEELQRQRNALRPCLARPADGARAGPPRR
ncbi:MAG: hemerythrin domain-containing protein [Bryobacteraceae bacterium]